MTWMFDIGTRNALIADLQLARGNYGAADVCLNGNSVEETNRRARNTARRSQIDAIIHRLTSGKGYVDRANQRWADFRQRSLDLAQATQPCGGKPHIIDVCGNLDQALDVVDNQLVDR